MSFPRQSIDYIYREKSHVIVQNFSIPLNRGGIIKCWVNYRIANVDEREGGKPWIRGQSHRGFVGNCIKRFCRSRCISRIGSTILFSNARQQCYTNSTVSYCYTRAHRRFLCTRFLAPLRVSSSRATLPPPR